MLFGSVVAFINVARSSSSKQQPDYRRPYNLRNRTDCIGKHENALLFFQMVEFFENREKQQVAGINYSISIFSLNP